MATVTTTTTNCDACGKEQREKDKALWLRVNGCDGSLLIGVQIVDARLAEGMEPLDFCSPKCLHKRVNEVLGVKNPGRPKGARTRKPKTAEAPVAA